MCSVRLRKDWVRVIHFMCVVVSHSFHVVVVSYGTDDWCRRMDKELQFFVLFLL